MANLRRALLFTIPRIHNASQRSSVANSALPSLSLYRPLAGTFSCFFTSNENFQPIDFDLSSEESKRRLFNRLRYRSKQRGFLELDLVLGKWVEDHIQSMDEYGIKSLVDILDLENPDLWKGLTGQEQPPDAISTNSVFSAVREKVMNNLGKHAAPETCAAAGQPWVIG
ncbi:succinate dehydrogenase assembly factor 2, mitochondrial-like isoform X1 [Nicotiana tomentosiformis]|uniref:succinate dehydrogenase assembly factor 2, mitochondrial-like isoform X1 n=1 Tax=Nicotiana tomentosiformis TaxID=4098 RepID=UPI000878732D|nr:succinate dehydrogenase assembly factor 2, mitochondrial-like isoform X1 [Nicotiana tomentosiformis]